jgi:hypothetical protein
MCAYAVFHGFLAGMSAAQASLVLTDCWLAHWSRQRQLKLAAPLDTSAFGEQCSGDCIASDGIRATAMASMP